MGKFQKNFGKRSVKIGATAYIRIRVVGKSNFLNGPRKWIHLLKKKI